jgi:hypothetical protein
LPTRNCSGEALAMKIYAVHVRRALDYNAA